MSPGFAALCQTLAGEGDKAGRSVAANGTVSRLARIAPARAGLSVGVSVGPG